MPTEENYAWYRIVSGNELAQGDLFDNCPVYSPPEDLANAPLEEALFTWSDQNVIALSQTCDMVRGREKIQEALLCPVWLRSELTDGYLASAKGMEDARRGNLPGYHVLAACDLAGFEREVCVADFRRVYSLPLSFLRRRGGATGSRLRLLPPYREHLSQAFARYFMRVGLPTDIPPFR